MKIVNYCNKIIEYSFYALFLLVPLAFTSSTSELFEFNKMWLTFTISAIIGCGWAIKIILTKEFRIQKTPLDIPIILFLVSQIISTAYSLDIHLSLWGYYSRFNGGLLSIIDYIFLYYAFVTNFNSFAIVKKNLLASLTSGIIVALWGLPSHFGYDPTCFLFRGTLDVSCWTEDFQPKVRIFSTLGQPDWLSAYLAILIPIAAVFFIYPVILNNNLLKILFERVPRPFQKLKQFYNEKGLFLAYLFFLVTFALFFVDLLYTRSRGGMLGITASLLFLASVLGLKNAQNSTVKIKIAASALLTYASLVLLERKDKTLFIGIFLLSLFAFLFFIFKSFRNKTGTIYSFRKRLGLIALIFTFACFIIGSPLNGLENFHLDKIKNEINLLNKREPTATQPKSKQVGGTHAGDIRLIVWKGAIEIWKKNPIFGTGVETFAFAYYKYRPVEHNLTSEWDYLYNKAHNEYLNYLATTGAVGLGTYLFLIGIFLLIAFRKIFKYSQKTIDSKWLLAVGLIASYLSILISNFFGFSVVIVNVYFFLLPAFVLVLLEKIDTKHTIAIQFSKSKIQEPTPLSKTPTLQWALLMLITLFTVFLLVSLLRFWLADIDYSEGFNFNRAGEYEKGYLKLYDAIGKRADEPVFKDEFAQTAAVLSVALHTQKESTTSATLKNQAIAFSDEITKEYPNNVTFLKGRVRVFYALSQIDKTYLSKALEAISKAKTLAPTDAKVSYNLAILYGQNSYIKQAIETLQETIKLKPDYYDAYYALGLFYRELAVDDKGKIIDPKLQEKAVGTMHYILDHFASDDAKVLDALKSWKEK